MPLVVRYDADKGAPPVLLSYLRKLGWQEYDEELPPEEQPTWNLWWKNNRFTASQLAAPRYPFQRLNHFPKSSEITKKDTLLRNLRRMRGVYGQVCDFLPTTFVLPGDYVKFCQDYAAARDETPDLCYICKPSDMSRGRKIFLFRDIGDLTYDCSVVVQRYIDRPLLMAGHKFDLRIYVLVTAFQPLRVYLYRNYLVRFATEKYDVSDLSNLFSHLTNSSINKLAPGYAIDKDVIGEGCKWDAPQFEAWLERVGVPMDVLWTRMETMVITTLLSICSYIPSNPPCFELYGFDLIIDEAFKVWLLEVNFAPALQIDGPVDTRVKRPLIADMMDTLRIPGPCEDRDDPGCPSRNPQFGRRAPRGAPPAAPPPGAGPPAGPAHSAGAGRAAAAARGRSGDKGPAAAPPPPRAGSQIKRRPPPHADPTGCADAAAGAAAEAVEAAPAPAPAAAGAGAKAPKRSASQQRLSEVRAKVSAGRSTRSGSAGGQRVGEAYSSATPLIDEAAGQFDLIFPFNDTTRQCAERVAREGGQDKEGSMRTIMQEIKKRELPAIQKSKAFPKLHQDFMERLLADPSLLEGLAKPGALGGAGCSGAAGCSAAPPE
eukprot:TRINITY_DN14914_c0_g1_i1.p1 TRINITY_DN14914_c0_g1~~TRINITY_DN14914_c0_g1_i1.p1  ORF type:complete len:600 (+),score=172.18 TRINITY_DN14914_c0_g1_i1:141-1940(+)